MVISSTQSGNDSKKVNLLFGMSLAPKIVLHRLFNTIIKYFYDYITISKMMETLPCSLHDCKQEFQYSLLTSLLFPPTFRGTTGHIDYSKS